LQAGRGYEIGLDLPTLDNEAVEATLRGGRRLAGGEPPAW
jgi:hypothetical protein